MESPAQLADAAFGGSRQSGLHPFALDGRPEETEPHLIAARNGCRRSMGELLETCRADLLDLANATLGRHLRAKADPDDLVQDALLEAQRDFDQFRGATGAELRGWLRSILRHRLADFARHFGTTDKRQVSREVSYDTAASETNNPGDLAALLPAADENLIRHEELTELRRRLDDLPPHYRQVVLWHGQEERSFVEIGVILGRKPDAVRMLYARALHTLRASLA